MPDQGIIRINHTFSKYPKRGIIQDTPFNEAVSAVKLKNHRATSN
ncbi:hypothetical protein C4K18_5403 [Pseudomonas chlororaphis subsp. aurantiaca]|nr:hypothetical protein C4K18_5403 [Pseudomonas chlororaphis subsp. aurantiaca]